MLMEFYLDVGQVPEMFGSINDDTGGLQVSICNP